MKIIDPSLCPNDFGPLLFQPLGNETCGGEVFTLVSEGKLLGELSAALPDDTSRLVLDEYQGWMIPRAGSWSLRLADEDGRVSGTHILWPGSASDRQSPSFTDELAVWATLVTIWATTKRASQRG